MSVFNCAAVKKMEAIGCLVPKLQRETHCAFFIVTVNLTSPFTIVLHKIDSCSCKNGTRTSAKTVGEDSGGESRDLHCVYR